MIIEWDLPVFLGCWVISHCSLKILCVYSEWSLSDSKCSLVTSELSLRTERTVITDQSVIRSFITELALDLKCVWRLWGRSIQDDSIDTPWQEGRCVMQVLSQIYSSRQCWLLRSFNSAWLRNFPKTNSFIFPNRLETRQGQKAS